ncbi:MAG: aminotransferase class IV, partial [Bacteroidales bacterium]
MSECFGNYYIHNGTLQPVELFDNSLVYEGESVYEVLRMMKGLPVFFDDHVTRLESSTRFQKKLMLAGREQLRKDILKLSETEKIKDVNLKIVFNYNGSTGNYLVYFIEPVYPTAEQYRKGVKCVLFHAERKDPESKFINHKLRSEIYYKLIIENAYEALLVNKENCITEGSRSNVFFIKEEKLVTAPDKFVLGGITRTHILDICRENSIKVELVCV